MWAIAIVALNVLTGPIIHIVTEPVDEPHVYASEEACKAELAKEVPSRLDGEALEQYNEGYRRFVCVRVGQTELLKVAP